MLQRKHDEGHPPKARVFGENDVRDPKARHLTDAEQAAKRQQEGKRQVDAAARQLAAVDPGFALLLGKSQRDAVGAL